MDELDNEYMGVAIDLALNGMRNNEGGPFGAIVVKDNKIIGRGNNCVTSLNDPTAHAEVMAIRDACRNINSFQLEGCIIYTSCEPCPMCLGAIYWARPQKVFFGCTRNDAAEINFDDDFIYQELSVPISNRKIPMLPLQREYALTVFAEWKAKMDKKKY